MLHLVRLFSLSPFLNEFCRSFLSPFSTAVGNKTDCWLHDFPRCVYPSANWISGSFFSFPFYTSILQNGTFRGQQTTPFLPKSVIPSLSFPWAPESMSRTLFFQIKLTENFSPPLLDENRNPYVGTISFSGIGCSRNS